MRGRGKCRKRWGKTEEEMRRERKKTEIVSDYVWKNVTQI